MRTILTAAWAAVLFVTSLPASAAQPVSNAPSVRVDYSDLDLTGSHGVSTLEHRVTGAIHQVCGGPAFELNEKLRQQACERSAETTAHKSIENAITTAKQLPMTSPAETGAPGIVRKAISNPSQQRWIRDNVIPRR